MRETFRAYDTDHCDSCFILIPCGHSWVTPAMIAERCPDCGWPIPTGSCGRCANEARETLTDFLLARIAEDERVAREPVMFDSDGWAGLADRVLAECEAKRRIVEAHREWDENDWQSPAYFSAPMDLVLSLLALPYADHPDYREEWRP